jgi:glutamate synthase (NADPH/NADH) small chain
MTDTYFAKPGAPLFRRAAPTGRRIAVVGAGRRACRAHTGRAARPRRHGIRREAETRRSQRMWSRDLQDVGGFAQKEIEWLLSIGGIELRCGRRSASRWCSMT